MNVLFERLCRAVLLLSPALVAACGGGGADLTRVTVIATSCPGGAGTLPNTSCRVLQIQTPGNAPSGVELRVSEPPGAVVGTVFLGAGGSGTEFFANQPGGSELIVDLLAQGFRVVDRLWYEGWMSPAPRLVGKSSRPAALIRWVRDNVHTVGAFCALGFSGGATAIAYGLTTHDLEDVLDVVVFTGGPGKARLDYLCLTPTAAWALQCPALVPPGVMLCSTPCTSRSGQACAITHVSPTAAELVAESILHPGADLDYPTTLVHMLLGALDCSTTVPQALLFRDSMTTPSVLAFVPGAPHAVHSTAAGRTAIAQALLGAQPESSGPAGPYVRFSVTVIEGERSATVNGQSAPDGGWHARQDSNLRHSD